MAVRIDLAEVAAIEPMVHEHSLRPLRVVVVALHDAGATDPNDADLAVGHVVAILTPDLHLGLGQRRANGAAPIVLGESHRDHGTGFGEAIAVDFEWGSFL